MKRGERAMAKGLIPQDEFEKRRERMNVLRSRQEELETRVGALRKERAQTTDLTSTTEGTHSNQLALRSNEISALNRRIGLARQAVKEAAQKLDEDKIRAAAQREKRLKQVQIQIDELNTLLDASEATLSARAPWDGVVGFREPSPASVRSDVRPLLVLFQPGKVFDPCAAPRRACAGLSGRKARHPSPRAHTRSRQHDDQRRARRAGSARGWNGGAAHHMSSAAQRSPRSGDGEHHSDQCRGAPARSSRAAWTELARGVRVHLSDRCVLQRIAAPVQAAAELLAHRWVIGPRTDCHRGRNASIGEGTPTSSRNLSSEWGSSRGRFQQQVGGCLR